MTREKSEKERKNGSKQLKRKLVNSEKELHPEESGMISISSSSANTRHNTLSHICPLKQHENGKDSWLTTFPVWKISTHFLTHETNIRESLLTQHFVRPDDTAIDL